MNNKNWIILGLLMLLLIYFATCGFGSGEENNDLSLHQFAELDSNQVLDTTIVTYSENEKAQLYLDSVIAFRLEDAYNQKAYVKDMLAGFKLGMTRKQVENHVMKMARKGYMKSVQKTRKLSEFVYPMKLNSGTSNVFLDFAYSTKGGIYRAVCHPRKIRKLNSAELLEEVKTELEDWYGAPLAVFRDQESCNRYVWITGIQYLDLYCNKNEKVEFVYIDLRMQKPKGIVEIQNLEISS